MISIFLPTYNCASFVGGTIESILSQTYSDFELLCVDDGSTDDTLSVLHSFASADSRIQIFSKANQGSVPYSWNFIFPHLNGEYTLYLSHDDYLPPTFLVDMLSCATSAVDAVIASVRFFETDYFSPEQQYSELNRKNDMSKKPPISGRKAFLQMLNYDIPGFALWRTNLIKQIGMPTESFNSDEAMQRIWALNCREVAFSSACFGYRQSGNAIVKGLKAYHYASLLTQKRILKELSYSDFLFNAYAHRFEWQFLRSLLYLTRQFLKRRNVYSATEQSNIKHILFQAWNIFY